MLPLGTDLPTNKEQQCKKSNSSFATWPEASLKGAAQPSPVERGCHLTPAPSSTAGTPSLFLL